MSRFGPSKHHALLHDVAVSEPLRVARQREGDVAGHNGVAPLGPLGARAGRDCAEFELGKESRCFAGISARALRVGAREHL